MAVGPGACFGSQAPLISAEEAEPVFGAQGEAIRVMFDQLGGPQPEIIQFRWQSGSYQVARRGRLEPASYRLKHLTDQWYIWEKFQDGEAAAYGLARLEDFRVWAYAPECGALPLELHQRLALKMEPDGTCWLASPKQLQQAMRGALNTPMRLIGYFEFDQR